LPLLLVLTDESGNVPRKTNASLRRKEIVKTRKRRNLQYPNAAVLLVPPSSFGPGRWPGREQYIANEIAGAGLHETLHLAGRNGQYSDVALARATLDIAAARGWKLPSEADRQKILSDEFAASYYWGGILRSKCKPSSERH
jgi:hypothetical protein